MNRIKKRIAAALTAAILAAALTVPAMAEEAASIRLAPLSPATRRSLPLSG